MSMRKIDTLNYKDLPVATGILILPSPPSFMTYAFALLPPHLPHFVTFVPSVLSPSSFLRYKLYSVVT